MKKTTIILAAVGLIVMFLASLAVAQSLGDLARREKARRAKETKKPVKVLTSEDFPSAPPVEEARSAEPAEGEAPASESAEQPTEQPGEEAAAPSEETPAAPAAEEAKPEDKQKTRDYWQGRFRTARQRIADAEEVQRLTEDELSLLQIQQAREIDSVAKSDLDAQVQAKSTELASKRATTAKARKALADLEKEFKESGAPAEWSKTD